MNFGNYYFFELILPKLRFKIVVFWSFLSRNFPVFKLIRLIYSFLIRELGLDLLFWTGVELCSSALTDCSDRRRSGLLAPTMNRT